MRGARKMAGALDRSHTWFRAVPLRKPSQWDDRLDQTGPGILRRGPKDRIRDIPSGKRSFPFGD